MRNRGLLVRSRKLGKFPKNVFPRVTLRLRVFWLWRLLVLDFPCHSLKKKNTSPAWVLSQEEIISKINSWMNTRE